MKIAITLLILSVASAALAAPIEEAGKSKRGLALGLGYHAPLVAPAVLHSTSYVHHEPIVHAAPLISHAPLVAHGPILPTYHAFHHF